MNFMKQVFIFSMALFLSGNIYGAGTHTRTAKNGAKDSVEKAFVIVARMTDTFVAAKAKVGEISSHEELTKYLEDVTAGLMSDMQTMMEIFNKYPELADDEEFYEKGQKMGDELEDAYDDLLNAIEEWCDKNGVTEEEKNKMKDIIDNGLNQY